MLIGRPNQQERQKLWNKNIKLSHQQELVVMKHMYAHCCFRTAALSFQSGHDFGRQLRTIEILIFPIIAITRQILASIQLPPS